MFGKLLGAMIGAGIGLALQSAAAAIVLGAIGLLIGHRIDSLHEVPDLDAEFAQFSAEDDELPRARGIHRMPRGVEEPARTRRSSTGDADDVRATTGHGPATEGAGAPGRQTRRSGAADDGRAHREQPPTEAEARDGIAATCALLVELARIDGDVNRDEVRAAREYFENTLRVGARDLQRVRNHLKASIASSPVDAEKLATEASAELDTVAREKLLSALYDLAVADADLRRSERDLLRKIARALNVDEDAHRAIAQSFFGDGSAHYATLGVDPDISDDDLKAAFRRLAAQHHPDRATHLGPRAAEQAAARFREIQAAYEELRRIRNL